MDKKWIFNAGWITDDRWTMPAYIRKVVNEKDQIIIQLSNKSGWRLVINGQEEFRDKNLRKVLKMADEKMKSNYNGAIRIKKR